LYFRTALAVSNSLKC